MALDPTLSELHLKKSVMKFLQDNLEVSPHDLNLFFELLVDVPKDNNGDKLDNWVIVSFEDRDLDYVASAYLVFDLFTRKDNEGFDMSRITDSITEVLKDEDSTNNLKTIPYFDTTDAQNWVQVGGILPFQRRTTGVMPGRDNTLIRTMSYELKWGAK